MNSIGSHIRGSKGMLPLLILLLGSAVPSLALPQTGQPDSAAQPDRSTDPVFNVWEYAIINDRSNLQPPQPPQADQPAFDSPAIGQQDPGQNACMWAIINCCHGNIGPLSLTRQTCFDYNGCAGAWFQDLCSDDFVRIAHAHILGVLGGNVFQ